MLNKTRFVVVDLEMANNDLASICQLGLIVFDGFEPIEKWETMVDPQADFGYYQTKVHGFTARDVQAAPKIEALKDRLFNLIENQVVCSFGMNDFHALNKNFELPVCTWMDVSKVATRIWTETPKNMRNLKSLCATHDIPLSNHHNALGDALATGMLLNKGMQFGGFTIPDLLKFSMKNIGNQNNLL